MAANLPPPGIDLSEDQGSRIVASMVALIVLPTLAVIARLLSRYLAHAGFWYDDLWVVISLLLSYGPIICVLICKSLPPFSPVKQEARLTQCPAQGTNGFGRHIWALEDPKFTVRFMEILYIYAIFFYLSSTAIKICILLFYRRIFPVRELKLALQIAMGIVIAYFFGSVLSLIFQCAPIDKYWNREKPGSCVNGDIVLIVPGAINAVLNFLIIALPIPLLWKLRTTVSQKSVLTGIFVCAGFVCIISIIRLVVLSRLHHADVTWNFVNSAIWSAAEPCMGVVSACAAKAATGRPAAAPTPKQFGGAKAEAKAETTVVTACISNVSRTHWRTNIMHRGGGGMCLFAEARIWSVVDWGAVTRSVCRR
ncbi:MAG: hypothetical protein LQ341_006147 [Variospora aurantia]|nr:MAG: hypothetical protein LQ341_006147 [Variospora aurantia]